eukprot:COSAG01_NODE_11594_length_1897_cov_10.718020_3_plen_111_part_00
MKHESGVRQAFTIFDTNNDGVLDAAKFQALFQQHQEETTGPDACDREGGALPTKKKACLSDEVRQVMSMIDTDESGTVEVEEFLEWLEVEASGSKGVRLRRGTTPRLVVE